MQIPPGVAELLHTANRVVAMTGAGVSAESGVPTFRDAQTGLWAKYDPVELATPQAFVRNPKLVWDWYQWRRSKTIHVAPNAGHFALVELSSFVPSFSLVTQNVDGLHQRAGSLKVIELHGNISRAKCFDAGHIAQLWPDDSQERPPKCSVCSSLMRPDVVWFNEQLPHSELEAAIESARTCDVFISIGTSSVVYPAAALAHTAMEAGAKVIEINSNETPLTSLATFSLVGKSGEILPLIVEAMTS